MVAAMHIQLTLERLEPRQLLNYLTTEHLSK